MPRDGGEYSYSPGSRTDRPECSPRRHALDLITSFAVLKSDFHYDLPLELIAQFPAAERTGARLLCLDAASGQLADRRFVDLPDLLRCGDVLVFNDTRVIPARLYGAKDTGGRVEVMVERVLDQTRVLARVRASKAPKVGQYLDLDGGARAHVAARQGELFELAFEAGVSVSELLDRIGHVPLPPYINRADSALDRKRYQTVYARHHGAVAAPTAGLHFDAALLRQLAALGVGCAFVTLHVGAGTFQPLRENEVEGQRLHAERMHVSAVACEQINAARTQGRRIVAVGTTVVRALESASQAGTLAPYDGDTEIFIHPGYSFKMVDALITNFHLPESSLLMLVCAFAGTDRVLTAYRHAVRSRYRFYSYGDAMFVLP